jgi:hypothetical protein
MKVEIVKGIEESNVKNANGGQNIVSRPPIKQSDHGAWKTLRTGRQQQK